MLCRNVLVDGHLGAQLELLLLVLLRGNTVIVIDVINAFSFSSRSFLISEPELIYQTKHYKMGTVVCHLMLTEFICFIYNRL